MIVLLYSTIQDVLTDMKDKIQTILFQEEM